MADSTAGRTPPVESKVRSSTIAEASMKHALPLLAATFFWSLSAPAQADEQPGTQTSARLNAQVQVQLGYLLYLPKDYDKQESWPLMLFLHGAGERGDDLEQVKRHGPPKLLAAGKEFPFIVVSPQCPKG